MDTQYLKSQAILLRRNQEREYRKKKETGKKFTEKAEFMRILQEDGEVVYRGFLVETMRNGDVRISRANRPTHTIAYIDMTDEDLSYSWDWMNKNA